VVRLCSALCTVPASPACAYSQSFSKTEHRVVRSTHNVSAIHTCTFAFCRLLEFDPRHAIGAIDCVPSQHGRQVRHAPQHGVRITNLHFTARTSVLNKCTMNWPTGEMLVRATSRLRKYLLQHTNRGSSLAFGFLIPCPLEPSARLRLQPSSSCPGLLAFRAAFATLTKP
jgi:hypothetical protein